MKLTFRSKKLEKRDFSFFFGEDSEEACALLAKLSSVGSDEVGDRLMELVKRFPYYHNLRLAAIEHCRAVGNEQGEMLNTLEALFLFPHSFLVLAHVHRLLANSGNEVTRKALEDRIVALRTEFERL